MRIRSALAVTGLPIAASLGSAGAARADPHDLASTTILVPTSFGEFHGTVTDSDGNVIDEFVDPPMTKGSSGNQARATTTSCTVTIAEIFDDPVLGTLTFTGEGSVTGFVTPVR